MSNQEDVQTGEETVVAPSQPAVHETIAREVEVLASLPGRAARLANEGKEINADKDTGDIVAVRQGNVFGTSFHPELTDDARIHAWWLRQVEESVNNKAEKA